MKHALAVAILLLASCKKDPTEHYVAYQAKGRMYAIEWRAVDGSVHRDTITFNVVNGDTVATSGKWNLMAAEGDQLSIRACSLLPDTASYPVEVSITPQTAGDAYATKGGVGGCVVLDMTFHQ